MSRLGGGARARGGIGVIMEGLRIFEVGFGGRQGEEGVLYDRM